MVKLLLLEPAVSGRQEGHESQDRLGIVPLDHLGLQREYDLFDWLVSIDNHMLHLEALVVINSFLP